MTVTPSTRPLNIGFVSTRFSGTDVVSLEAENWAGELEEMGHTCFYFSGESDRPAERSHVAAEAYFQHPAIAAINDIAFEEPWGRQDLLELLNTSVQGAYNESFSQYIRPPRVTKRIRELADHLKGELYAFVQKFEIELFIVENALTIPMNIPLGVAITEVIAETGMPTIAHHHDFYWERQRYLVNCVTDYLKACFPPTLPSIQHVVISSWAARQLSLNAGVSATVIPNVMDFDHPPETPDGYLTPLRTDLGLLDGELLILQPTRVVQRKGIEHAIELVKRLCRPARLVISHASGDEGGEYEQHVREFARLLDVPATFVSGIISTQRGTTPDGRRIYTLADVYAKADLVTYPSTIEGFGNAFLESIYYRRPLVVNNYSIYAIDIKPKGFQVIEFDGFVSQRTIDETCKVLDNPPLVERMVEQNYALGRKHYSHTVLAHQLAALLGRF